MVEGGVAVIVSFYTYRYYSTGTVLLYNRTTDTIIKTTGNNKLVYSYFKNGCPKVFQF